MLQTEHLSKRYQVFVSSTFKDLVKERAEIGVALNKSNYIVEGMELFPASNKKQWEVIKDRIRKSDIYVLIIGDKYGSVANNGLELEPEVIYDGTPISYTRLEFRFAKKLKIPILAFIKKSTSAELNVLDFINEIQTSDLTTADWKKKADLIPEILASLKDTITAEGFSKNNGWVKVSSLDQPIDVGNKNVFIVEKVQYAKFISYSDKKHSPKPLYRKFILRLEKEFDVWDEYVTLTVTQLSHYVSSFEHYMRTDGDAIDFTSFFPFINKFNFADVKAGMNDRILNPIIEKPSNTYVNSCSFINGFQDGNMDMAVKANKSCKKMMLIVDFTSLPNNKELFRLVKCVRMHINGMESLIKDFYEPQDGIYISELLNVDKGEVMKFIFEKNINSILHNE